jgi:hypothetical protein
MLSQTFLRNSISEGLLGYKAKQETHVEQQAELVHFDFLPGLFLYPEDEGDVFFPKLRLTFSGLHDILSPKINLSTTTVLRTSTPRSSGREASLSLDNSNYSPPMVCTLSWWWCLSAPETPGAMPCRTGQGVGARQRDISWSSRFRVGRWANNLTP